MDSALTPRQSTVHVASTVNGTMGSVPWNNNYSDRFTNQTSSQQNINDALNGTNNIGKVTHHDLWGGIFGGMYNQASNISHDSVDSTDQEDDLTSGFNTVNGKSRRGRAKKNLGTALLEELDMADQGLQYDWADIAMGNYKTGNIENGYKIAIAMSLLDETTKIGEKMLIFSQNLTALSLIEEYLDRRKLITAQGEYNWQKNRNYFTNRCIILDACWNPCHDAQAVCRVYRYDTHNFFEENKLTLIVDMDSNVVHTYIASLWIIVWKRLFSIDKSANMDYNENLDVVQDKWDTSLWHMDDSVLEEVAKRHSNMIAGEPFLHESLMLEREEGLSEQEKLEAQLLFEREKAEEIYGDARIDQLEHGQMMQSNSLIPRGVPRWAAQTFNFPHLDPPALRATPMPHHLDMVTSGQFRGGLVNNLSMMNGNLNMDGGIGLGLPYMGSMFPGMERQMGMRPDYIPSPVAAFPGAAIAYEPCTNSNGSVQRIRTDRRMS
uniref:Tyrosine-protein phosphatase domain-containing protein n=1 Tax=Heterorhabditis bacteriophora TaxID=37862 RepID=A0A1I7WMZ6_HETBA